MAACVASLAAMLQQQQRVQVQYPRRGVELSDEGWSVDVRRATSEVWHAKAGVRPPVCPARRRRVLFPAQPWIPQPLCATAGHSSGAAAQAATHRAIATVSPAAAVLLEPEPEPAEITVESEPKPEPEPEAEPERECELEHEPDLEELDVYSGPIDIVTKSDKKGKASKWKAAHGCVVQRGSGAAAEVAGRGEVLSGTGSFFRVYASAKEHARAMAVGDGGGSSNGSAVVAAATEVPLAGVVGSTGEAEKKKVCVLLFRDDAEIFRFRVPIGGGVAAAWIAAVATATGSSLSAEGADTAVKDGV